MQGAVWSALHQVQLERGISCVAVASCGRRFVIDLPRVRVATDAAVEKLSLGVATLSVRLSCVRKLVDESLAQFESSKAPIRSVSRDFYDIFTDYGELVKLLLEASCLSDKTKTRAQETFALLKEELARERGFVAGVLALPEDTIDELPSRAFADFVVSLHAQRAHAASLQDRSSAEEIDIVKPGLTPTPQLSVVQQRLLLTFDVRGVRKALDLDTWWPIVTSHIEKMNEVQSRLQALAAATGGSSGGSSEGSDPKGEHGPAAEARALVKRTAAAIAGTSAAGAGKADEMIADLESLATSLANAPAEALKHQMVEVVQRRAKKLASSPTARLEMALETPPARSNVPLVPDEWRVPLSELAFVCQIGHGSTGTCYRAQWRGSSTSVAVKVAHSGSEAAWLSEMSTLCKLHHPNVVQLLGAVLSPPTFCLVLEYCHNGDLFEALQKPTPPGFTISVARGVAAGMVYLHSRGLLHRDLKSANVLLDAHNVPKVTDFGCATDGGTNAPHRNNKRGHLTAETGTYRWMAPEVVNHEQYSRPADVFSYSMILFELLTHEIPFSDLPPVLAASAIGVGKQRPVLPHGTPPSIASLMEQCWASEPSNRPSFDSIDKHLALIVGALSPQERVWLDVPTGHPVVRQSPATMIAPGGIKVSPAAASAAALGPMGSVAPAIKPIDGWTGDLRGDGATPVESPLAGNNPPLGKRPRRP